MIALTVLVLIQGSSQTSFLETKALAFFRDSIRQGLPVKGQGDIWFDGLLIQDTIDQAKVQEIVLEGFLTWKVLRDKKLTATEYKKYDEEKKIYEDLLNHWETFIPNRKIERLESIEPLQKTKKLRFERFLRKRLNLRIRQAFKFADFNWIEIRLDKSDYEYGYHFYLKMDDRGNVQDWSDVYWIQ
jgi:hypothetical protein